MAPPLIAFAAYDGMTLLDLVGPFEVLSLWPDAETVVVARSAGVVTPDSRTLPVMASKSFAELEAADIVVVPGGPTPEAAKAHVDLHLWLSAIQPRTKCVMSVCTGAFHLGEAGLLKGKRATTHWAAMDALAAFGAKPERARWVDEGSIVTAAGVSAGIDAALHLTRREQGEELARAIQLMIEYDPAPPFDAGSPEAAGPAIIGALGTLLGPAMAKRSGQGNG